MSLTDGKNILVYVETAQGAPVGPALEILAKAKELAAAKGEEVIAAILAEAPEEAAKTAVEAHEYFGRWRSVCIYLPGLWRKYFK